MILRSLNLDQDNMSKHLGKGEADEDDHIFKGSYELLVSQATHSSEKYHKMHEKLKVPTSGGGSKDNYERATNAINWWQSKKPNAKTKLITFKSDSKFIEYPSKNIFRFEFIYYYF